MNTFAAIPELEFEFDVNGTLGLEEWGYSENYSSNETFSSEAFSSNEQFSCNENYGSSNESYSSLISIDDNTNLSLFGISNPNNSYDEFSIPLTPVENKNINNKYSTQQQQINTSSQQFFVQGQEQQSQQPPQFQFSTRSHVSQGTFIQPTSAEPIIPGEHLDTQRKEKNRETSRRSRHKKKMYLETLHERLKQLESVFMVAQTHMQNLATENNKLKIEQENLQGLLKVALDENVRLNSVVLNQAKNHSSSSAAAATATTTTTNNTQKTWSQ
eukprot:c1469_g1_i1.p1 GENE.c1469_g1_i1~~c1469_g1_i1.p1  ORF type:complete len:272 (-),score=119.56 c1469_g1_i1:76-891(-)